MFGQTEKVVSFVCKALGFERDFGECQAIGFYDGSLVAGVVYHNWNPEAGVIEISAASLNRAWLTRENLRLIFEYPFEIGVQTVVCRTSEHNKTVRRIWKALGANEFVIPRLRGPNEAESILTLTKEDWSSSKFSKGYENG